MGAVSQGCYRDVDLYIANRHANSERNMSLYRFRERTCSNDEATGKWSHRTETDIAR